MAKMTAGRIQLALAAHFNWFRNVCMTEWWIDGGQADFVFITPTGYATEVEIKISMSDWNADAHKKKWDSLRPSVARFFYAVPEALQEKIPAWLPEGIGVLAIQEEFRGRHRVRVIREAKRRKALRMSDKEIAHIHQRSYVRLWRYQFRHASLSE